MFEDGSSQLCRLCLKSGACPIDIYDPKRTNGFLVWEIIEELTEIKIYISDGLPPNICENCMIKLTDFKYFKKMCIDSRLEYLFRRINNELVVPMTEDESGPLREDLCGQGDVHTRDTWNNLEAEGIESEMHVEHEEVAKEMHPLVEYTSTIDREIYVEEMQSSGVHGSASEVTISDPELLPQGDLCLHLSSRSSDEGSDVEECALNVTGPEAEVQVKNQNEQEIPPADEYLFTSGEICSFEGVQCLDAHVSMSEQVPLTEELTDQDDLHLYLSSDSGDETSDAEDHFANITGPETEVTNLSLGDVIRETVFGDGESVGNRKKTPEGEKNLKGLKDPERRFSARLRYGAKVPVATRSHLKRRRISSQCRNGNFGPDEGIESTPSSTTGGLFCEENGERAERKEETRRESKHSNGAFPGNISSGSSVGDEKSEEQYYKCDECGKVFRSKDLIERHLNVPCGSELIDCGSSNKKFHTRKQCKRHRSLQCVSNVSKRREPRGVAVDVSGESDWKKQIKKRHPPTCHICKKNFSQRGNLNVHIKTVHIKERSFSCEICGKAFGAKGNLQSHMRSHNGVKPYTCSHCEKGFTRPGTLIQHILAVHEMQKPHTCGECGKAFFHKHHIKTHMLVHTGERPQTCHICSRSFSQKQHLKTHMLIHTGEKPHTCTLCSKTFRHNNSLKNHMAAHARNVPHP